MTLSKCDCLCIIGIGRTSETIRDRGNWLHYTLSSTEMLVGDNQFHITYSLLYQAHPESSSAVNVYQVSCSHVDHVHLAKQMYSNTYSAPAYKHDPALRHCPKVSNLVSDVTASLFGDSPCLASKAHPKNLSMCSALRLALGLFRHRVQGAAVLEPLNLALVECVVQFCLPCVAILRVYS